MEDTEQEGINFLDFVKEYPIAFAFVLFLAVVLWGGSMILAVHNDSEKARLTKNNLMLVKDNRELRQDNKKLTALEKCLKDSGFDLEPKK